MELMWARGYKPLECMSSACMPTSTMVISRIRTGCEGTPVIRVASPERFSALASASGDPSVEEYIDDSFI
jgi:hypothetical protein